MLIPTTRMWTRTVIPTTSRGVNNVIFDVSHVAFDVSSLCWEYDDVVTLPYVSSLAFYVGRVQMYRDFDL